MSTQTLPSRRTISEELLPPRLAAVGYVKIGGRKPEAVTSQKGNAFQPPVKFDHFRVTTRRRGADGNFELDEAVHAVVGEKPTELDARLPFDLPGENFYAQMVHYRGRTRERECNGERCTILATHVEEPCARRAGRECPCKPFGRLAVILEAAPTFGGLYVFRTTSWESVNSIQTALRMFREQFGSLRGLPLRLQLYEAEVRYQQGGQERTSTAYKVALVLRASYDEARAAALEYHRTNQIARREILQLAAGTTAELDELDIDDRSDIGEEFFPAAGPEPEVRPRSKLAAMNAALAEPGDTDGATREGAPAPASAPPTKVSPVQEAIDELRGLQARAELAGVRLTPAQVAKLDEAVETRDIDALEVSISWLRDKLPEDGEQRSLLGEEG